MQLYETVCICEYFPVHQKKKNPWQSARARTVVLGYFNIHHHHKTYSKTIRYHRITSPGIGIGQVISISLVTTYYVGIMGITLCYFYDSFRSPLPWSECRSEWGTHCVASSLGNTSTSLGSSSTSSGDFIGTSDTQQQPVASAELYFL